MGDPQLPSPSPEDRRTDDPAPTSSVEDAPGLVWLAWVVLVVMTVVAVLAWRIRYPGGAWSQVVEIVSIVSTVVLFPFWLIVASGFNCAL